MAKADHDLDKPREALCTLDAMKPNKVLQVRQEQHDAPFEPKFEDCQER